MSGPRPSPILLRILFLAILLLVSLLPEATVAEDPIATAVRIAREQLGKPYKWGGKGPDKFDCSGLVSYSYRAAGLAVDDGSATQFRNGSDPAAGMASYSLESLLSTGRLQSGDLLFFSTASFAEGTCTKADKDNAARCPQPGETPVNPLDRTTHVGIYLGGDQMLHAPGEGRVVEIAKDGLLCGQGCGWIWTTTFLGARRLGAPAPLPPPSRTPLSGTYHGGLVTSWSTPEINTPNANGTVSRHPATDHGLQLVIVGTFDGSDTSLLTMAATLTIVYKNGEFPTTYVTETIHIPIRSDGAGTWKGDILSQGWADWHWEVTAVGNGSSSPPILGTLRVHHEEIPPWIGTLYQFDTGPVNFSLDR
jgi:hypothetical protein